MRLVIFMRIILMKNNRLHCFHLFHLFHGIDLPGLTGSIPWNGWNGWKKMFSCLHKQCICFSLSLRSIIHKPSSIKQRTASQEIPTTNIRLDLQFYVCRLESQHLQLYPSVFLWKKEDQ